MFLRTILLIAVSALALGGCSGGTDVPDDQVIKPADPPSGWTTTDLGDLTVSAPGDWTKGETKKATDTIDITTWRSKITDGSASSGLEVRQISKPQQKAEKAARALALNASARLQAGAIEPEQVVWPGAESAYYLAYESRSDTTGREASYVTRTLVLDLANGRQLQVTSLVDKEQADTKIPDRVLSSVTLSSKGDA